jgi:hypothetical protein
MKEASKLVLELRQPRKGKKLGKISTFLEHRTGLVGADFCEVNLTSCNDI